jgi:hypothetical protein
MTLLIIFIQLSRTASQGVNQPRQTIDDFRLSCLSIIQVRAQAKQLFIAASPFMLNLKDWKLCLRESYSSSVING